MKKAKILGIFFAEPMMPIFNFLLMPGFYLYNALHSHDRFLKTLAQDFSISGRSVPEWPTGSTQINLVQRPMSTVQFSSETSSRSNVFILNAARYGLAQDLQEQ